MKIWYAKTVDGQILYGNCGRSPPYGVCDEAGGDDFCPGCMFDEEEEEEEYEEG